MTHELRLQDHDVNQQMMVDVIYKCHKVGVYRLDLVVDHKVVVELKAVSELVPVFK